MSTILALFLTGQPSTEREPPGALRSLALHPCVFLPCGARTSPSRHTVVAASLHDENLPHTEAGQSRHDPPAPRIEPRPMRSPRPGGGGGSPPPPPPAEALIPRDAPVARPRRARRAR